jgi:hypothetical protein
VTYRIALWVGLSVLGGCSAPDLDRQAVASYRPVKLHLTSRLSAAMPMFDTQTLVTSNGYLYVLSSGARFLHVFEQRSGKEIAAFGKSTLAAVDSQDFMPSPVWLDPDPVNGSAVWVYDAKRKDLASLELTRTAQSASLHLARSVHLQSRPFLWTPVWTSDQHIVATGLFTDGRVAVFDSTGQLDSVYGAVPVDGDSTNPHITQQAFRGRIAANDARTMFAIARRHADAIEIWDRRGKVRDIVGPLGFTPRYHVGKRGQGFDINFRGDTRYGYVSVATSGDRIYGLFSGRDQQDAGGRAALGRLVNVFDWSGQRRRSFELNCDAVAIAVGDDGRTLYAACDGRKNHDWIAAYSLAETN